MIKTILLLILIFIISSNNLLIYQLQYYETKRFLKVKKKNIFYKYLYTIPFVLIDVIINNNIFIIISLLFFILLSLEKKNKLATLKYTFRIYRILTINLIITFSLALIVNNYFLVLTFICLSLNSVFLIFSNYLDSMNRLIINKLAVNKVKRKLNNINPIIIGITGSYGKTSTKNYLESILKLKYNVLKTKGNINTFKGVINFLNEHLKEEINILIIEIGLDKKNGIDKFLKLFKFDYAFLTGIEKCHLATFKTIDNIISEKMKLIKNSKVGFINIDNKYLKDTSYNSYSLSDLDYFEVKDGLSHFKIKDIDKEFKTHIIGDHQILNIIGVIKYLNYLKVDLNLIYQGVLKLKNEPHRYELKKMGELLVIDDAYNANETSFKYSIDSLKYFNMPKVLITPGVIELGKENEMINYNLGVYIVDKVDEIVLIGKNSLNIKKALDDYNYLKYKYFNSFQEGINYLKNKENKNFITLIENDLLDYYLV